MQTVRAMWQSYALEVMPADAPPLQRQETRRAFYAGAWAMFCAAVEAGGGTAPTEAEGVAMLNGWRDELRAFGRKVEEGRA